MISKKVLQVTLTIVKYIATAILGWLGGDYIAAM